MVHAAQLHYPCELCCHRDDSRSCSLYDCRLMLQARTMAVRVCREQVIMARGTKTQGSAISLLSFSKGYRVTGVGSDGGQPWDGQVPKVAFTVGR